MTSTNELPQRWWARSEARRVNVDNWLERSPNLHGKPTSRLAVPIPAPILGGLALLSIIGCYAYYPEPREVFKEMSIIRAEVLTAATSGNKKQAHHFIPVWKHWTRRLHVGAFLREGSVSPYRRMKIKVFRDRLEFLKHAIDDQDRDELHEYTFAVEKAYQRMRFVYLGSSRPDSPAAIPAAAKSRTPPFTAAPLWHSGDPMGYVTQTIPP